MFKRMSLTLVLVLLTGSVLTACGGAPAPVTFGSLPVFTGATESTNEVLVAGLGTMNDAMKAEPTVQSVEGKAYDLPAGTTFDTLIAFYKPALEKAGWTVAVSSTPNLAFTRGKQGLNVGYIEAVGGLLVVLSNIK